MDNSVGIDCGSTGWAERRRTKRKNWDNCDRVTIIRTIYRSHMVTVTLYPNYSFSNWQSS